MGVMHYKNLRSLIAAIDLDREDPAKWVRWPTRGGAVPIKILPCEGIFEANILFFLAAGRSFKQGLNACDAQIEIVRGEGDFCYDGSIVPYGPRHEFLLAEDRPWAFAWVDTPTYVILHAPDLRPPRFRMEQLR